MKPILFNTEMVRAILDGRKSVTRRAVKDKDINNAWDCEADGTPIAYIEPSTGDSYPPTAPCPYQPGDILYVRETWAAWSRTAGTVPKLYYKADGNAPGSVKWRPFIHMPKEAAQIFLRVTGVRVERLQDITEYGAQQEGAVIPIEARDDPEYADYIGGYYNAFGELWDSTVKNADRAIYGWAANPWCWVIEFERIRREEAMKYERKMS